MKKAVIILILVYTCIFSNAQVPQAISYKAISKYEWSSDLHSRTISLRFTILLGSETGTPVYIEEQSTKTNQEGLINVLIGKGVPKLGNFNDINWSISSYYLKIEMDPNGGTEFRLSIPVNQIVSVPYSLYSDSSGNKPTGQYYYLDRDNDSYGDHFNPIWVPKGITPPSDYVTNSSDCNDSDQTTHPGAAEILNDGIDQDCDGHDLLDIDRDGIADNQDNCPAVSNPDQSDEDSDGIGDLCDYITDIDGNKYYIVKIGDQIWLRGNLKVTHYRNGDPIPLVINSVDWINRTTGAFSDYNNDPANGVNYYKLYNWYAVTDPRNLCPAGWRVPSDAEWTILNNFLTNNGYGYGGSGNDIAKSLATTSGWAASNIIGSPGNDQSSNNRTGFSVIPGGHRNPNGYYNVINNYSPMWSTTSESVQNAWRYLVTYTLTYLYRGPMPKNYGYGVRCIKDN